MNKIFLDSFTYRYRKSDSGLFFHRWFRGTYPQFDNEERLSFLFNIISSLLIHDKIVLRIDAIEEFIDLVGYEEFIDLNHENLIEILDDTGTYPSFLVQSNNLLMLMNMSDVSDMSLDSIEKRLDKKKLYTTKFDNIRESIKEIDGSWLANLAEQELYTDFQNENLTKYFNINSNDLTDIQPNDSFVISRLLNVNRSLIYLYEQDIKNVHIDGFSKLLLNQKFFNITNNINDNSIDLFKEIIKDKEIPDFSLLYKEKKINMDYILKLRNNFNGSKFRDWYKSTDYNRHNTYNELLKSPDKHVLESGLRFLTTTILGLINPFVGIASTVIDSFIVDKVRNENWIPNLFLDNELKKRLDKLK